SEASAVRARQFRSRVGEKLTCPYGAGFAFAVELLRTHRQGRAAPGGARHGRATLPRLPGILLWKKTAGRPSFEVRASLTSCGSQWHGQAPSDTVLVRRGLP